MTSVNQWTPRSIRETPTATGLILASFALTSLAGVLLATHPRLRVTQRTSVTIAFALGAAALWSLHDLNAHTTALDLQPPLILLGLASGIVNPTFTAGHLAAFSPRDGGIAAGVNSSARQLGTALGTAVLGALVQHGMGARANLLDGEPLDAFAAQALASEVGSALTLGALVLAALAIASARWLPRRHVHDTGRQIARRGHQRRPEGIDLIRGVRPHHDRNETLSRGTRCPQNLVEEGAERGWRLAHIASGDG